MSGEKSRAYVVASWCLVAFVAGFVFFASAHTGSSFDNNQDFLAILKHWMDGVLASWSIPGLKDSSSIGHFCEFTLLGFSLANALHCHMPWRKACVLAVVCASLYGVTDEFHQIFVPGRCCDAADWVVDTCGATVGMLVRWGYARLRVGKAAAE